MAVAGTQEDEAMTRRPALSESVLCCAGDATIADASHIRMFDAFCIACNAICGFVNGFSSGDPISGDDDSDAHSGTDDDDMELSDDGSSEGDSDSADD